MSLAYRSETRGPGVHTSIRTSRAGTPANKAAAENKRCSQPLPSGWDGLLALAESDQDGQDADMEHRDSHDGIDLDRESPLGASPALCRFKSSVDEGVGGCRCAKIRGVGLAMVKVVRRFSAKTVEEALCWRLGGGVVPAFSSFPAWFNSQIPECGGRSPMWSAITRNRRLGMLAAAEARAALGNGGVVPDMDRYAKSVTSKPPFPRFCAFVSMLLRQHSR